MRGSPVPSRGNEATDTGRKLRIPTDTPAGGLASPFDVGDCHPAFPGSGIQPRLHPVPVPPPERQSRCRGGFPAGPEHDAVRPRKFDRGKRRRGRFVPRQRHDRLAFLRLEEEGREERRQPDHGGPVRQPDALGNTEGTRPKWLFPGGKGSTEIHRQDLLDHSRPGRVGVRAEHPHQCRLPGMRTQAADLEFDGVAGPAGKGIGITGQRYRAGFHRGPGGRIAESVWFSWTAFA